LKDALDKVREFDGFLKPKMRQFAEPHLKDLFPHEFVRHATGRYVDGVVHTQTIDGFWSLLKRDIMGSFHKVSRKYLPLYVAEFQFRYNNRNNPDIFGAAIARC